jgi:hypothetical protein
MSILQISYKKIVYCGASYLYSSAYISMVINHGDGKDMQYA